MQNKSFDPARFWMLWLSSTLHERKLRLNCGSWLWQNCSCVESALGWILALPSARHLAGLRPLLPCLVGGLQLWNASVFEEGTCEVSSARDINGNNVEKREKARAGSESLKNYLHLKVSFWLPGWCFLGLRRACGCALTRWLQTRSCGCLLKQCKRLHQPSVLPICLHLEMEAADRRMSTGRVKAS